MTARTLIQFYEHDTPAQRLEKLRRLADLASLATAATATVATPVDGTQWFTGHGAPAASLGSAGDFYLDLDTGDIYELVS